MRRAFVGIAIVLTACGPTANGTNGMSAPVSRSSAAVQTAVVAPAITSVPTPRATASPAPPTPMPSLGARDSALLARLGEWCSLLRPGASPRPPLPLDLVADLSDGRTGRELVVLLGRANCQLPAIAWGDAAAEVVIIADYVGPGTLLWVDRGSWRVARLPAGYTYSRAFADHAVAGARELYLTIASGGSAGDVGVLVVRIVGTSATIALDVRLGSQLEASLLDDDHLLASARKLPDRPWGWTQNCCLPGGHEWLYERRAGGFVLAAERQTIGPEFALNAFVGAMAAGRADLAVDVATPSAIANAAFLITQADYWAGDVRVLGTSERDEQLSWEALRSPLRPDRREVTTTVGHYGPTGGIDRTYLATLGYVDGGWRVTSFGTPKRRGPT